MDGGELNLGRLQPRHLPYRYAISAIPLLWSSPLDTCHLSLIFFLTGALSGGGGQVPILPKPQ